MMLLRIASVVYFAGFLFVLGFILSCYDGKKIKELAWRILLFSIFWPFFLTVLAGFVIGESFAKSNTTSLEPEAESSNGTGRKR